MAIYFLVAILAYLYPRVAVVILAVLLIIRHLNRGPARRH
jgi:hypothetical protein